MTGRNNVQTKFNNKDTGKPGTPGTKPTSSPTSSPEKLVGKPNDGQTQVKTAGESNKSPRQQNKQVNVIVKKNLSPDSGRQKT